MERKITAIVKIRDGYIVFGKDWHIVFRKLPSVVR